MCVMGVGKWPEPRSRPTEVLGQTGVACRAHSPFSPARFPAGGKTVCEQELAWPYLRSCRLDVNDLVSLKVVAVANPSCLLFAGAVAAPISAGQNCRPARPARCKCNLCAHPGRRGRSRAGLFASTWATDVSTSPRCSTAGRALRASGKSRHKPSRLLVLGTRIHSLSVRVVMTHRRIDNQLSRDKLSTTGCRNHGTKGSGERCPRWSTRSPDSFLASFEGTTASWVAQATSSSRWQVDPMSGDGA